MLRVVGFGEIAAGHKDEIKAATKEAMKYPQGSMLFLDRSLLHFADLGGFLDALPASLSQPTQTAAQNARRFGAKGTPREQAHVAALDAWVVGEQSYVGVDVTGGETYAQAS